MPQVHRSLSPRHLLLVALTALASSCFAQTLAPARPLNELQRSYAEARFGAFIHFNMGTFTDQEWTGPNDDPKKFNPARLDCNQWARAFKSAGMKYAVLTTKHHDGFCLWPTKLTAYNVMNSSYKHDVVRAFVDAMRANGIVPVFYFSIWDRTQGVEKGRIGRAQINYVKGQLTELLSNYGPIPVLIIDGWAWQMGHNEMPYSEIREHVKKLQPNILICDHDGQTEPWENDIVYFEEPKGVWCPEGNTYCTNQGQTISNGWFWHPGTPKESLMSAESIADHLRKLEARHCNFILNCPPNRDGLYDENIVKRLAEVGKLWKPDMSRPALAAQPINIEHPVTPKSATATSGDAHNAIDGMNDVNGGGSINETLWKSDAGLPQAVTLDLGATWTPISMVSYFPPQNGGEKQGFITRYRISVSTDGTTFRQISTGQWTDDRRLKIAGFPPVAARYVKLEALEATGGFASANEIGAGSRTTIPASR